MPIPWHRVVIPAVLLGFAVCIIVWAWPINAPVAWVFAGPAIALGVFGILGLYRGVRVVTAARHGEVRSYPPPRWLREGSAALVANWIAVVLVIAAGVSLVWPVNNPYLSGECAPKQTAGDSCPVVWDRVDAKSLPFAIVLTFVLIAFTAFPLLHRRWYARVVALIPLVVLGFFGVFIFGPVYARAMLAMLVAAALSDRAGGAEV